MSTTDGGTQNAGDQGAGAGGDGTAGTAGAAASAGGDTGQGATGAAGTAAEKTWDEIFAGQKPEEVAKKLDHARTWESRAKDNAEKAKKFEELEEANKTEAQKAADKVAALEAENNRLKVESVRLEVAGAKGVPAGLLSGSTKEELEASADTLLAFKGTAAAAPSADGQGDTGAQVGDGKEKSAAEVVKEALG